ncbi:MAG: hypothetical protein GY711_05255 [bacterium]|nr:hypothetical protein [bacterium]
MARRRQNMLEAFKVSADKARAERAARAEGESEAPPTPPPADPDQRPVQSRRPKPLETGASSGLSLPIGAGAFLVLQALLLFVVFFMGRLSVQSTVEAGEGDGERGGGAVDLDPRRSSDASLEPRSTRRNGHEDSVGGEPGPSGTQPDPSAPNPADAAFLAPQNKFTVLVCTYDDTEYGRDRAWETFQHLGSLGFAAVTPRRQGGRLFLFVGASDSYQKLAELEKELKSASGPSGQRQPFRDAYRVNIDDYL